MNFRKAENRDLDKLLALYDGVIEQQKYDEYGASWTRGVYPTDSDIISHLEKGEIYLGEENDMVACACVIVPGEDDMYRKADWTIKSREDEIAVLHLLAVSKSFRGRGCALNLLEYIRTVLTDHFKVIHLDALVDNLPADRLYRKFGFNCIGRYPVWYEDLGDTEVFLYEYRL